MVLALSKVEMFLNTQYRNGWIKYDPASVRSTEMTEVAEWIAQGNQLRILGKRLVEVYRGDRLIHAIGGDEVSMCIFA